MRRTINEAKALQFLREYPKIPTPQLVAYCDEAGHSCVVTRLVEGVWLSKLEDPEDRRAACEEVREIHNRTKSITRDTPSSFIDELCLSNVARYYAVGFEVDELPWPGESFPLCHGDLHYTNIFVNPVSARVTGIIDWEHGGFYPRLFDIPKYALDQKNPPLPEFDQQYKEEAISFIALYKAKR